MRPARVSIYVARAALVLSASACSAVLGIEEAHVDPSLEQAALGVTPDDSMSQASGPANTVGAVCKPFDNAARLTRMVGGTLTPLPGGD